MLRSWNLKLELSKVSDRALYLQIAQKIIDEIQQGRLPPETVMPGTRDLAESLRVNRKTVMLTYDELIAQGWLVTENRRGTFVSKELPGFLPVAENEQSTLADPAPLNPVTLKQMLRFESRPTRDGIVNFSEEQPDARLMPFETLARAFRKALMIKSRNKQLEYDHPKGNLELRRSIASMLNIEKGLHVTADNICLVSSSQMAIFIAARTLTKPGDYIVFEHLTYPSARETFKSCGANLLKVNVDEYGICIDDLKKLCACHTIRAVFVTPQHQFPTTVTMSAERRKALLRLALHYNFMVIEDDRELHFSHDTPFPLASTDTSGKVIYIDSLSKIFSQGLRIAYLVATESFIEKCAEEVLLIDRQENSAAELAISELIHSGEITRHIRRMSKTYKERRDILQELLQSELYQWIDFVQPRGCLAFWLHFRKNIDMNELIKSSLYEKVRFSPGAYFADIDTDVQSIRLSFSSLNQKEIVEGVQRLKRALMQQPEFTYPLLAYS